MARPNWEYVRVDVLLPDNPKLDDLSASAKWTLVELWCYCGQHLTDGFVRDAKWNRFGASRDRAAILAAGLAEAVPGGYQMHDYLEHQRSREEVTELKAKRRKAGEASAAARAATRVRANAEASAEPVDNSRASASPQHLLTGNPTNSSFNRPVGNTAISGDAESITAGRPSSARQHPVEQTRSKPATEAEAEAEAEVLMADAGDQSSDRNPRIASEIDLIIEEISGATGQTISEEWAGKTRDLLLGGRAVADRCGYLRQAIRAERDPVKRFLPAPQPPPYQPPNGHPARGETVAAIAAQARQAIARGEPGG